jgi:F-type H+-transporting ATPase subunit delta
MAERSAESDAQYAAEVNADVGLEHVADVYAEALLGAAENAGQSEALLEEFDSLMGDVLEPNPKFGEILASGFLAPEEKDAILDRVFSGRASATLLNFLKVLAQHGRLDCLRAIHRQTRLMYDQRMNRVHVRLTTAAPVDDAAAERIRGNLRSVLGGEPVLERRVDPEVIGGAVLRIGDTVYDGSIATSLQNMRQQMIDRSVHEIQSRRDRFRNSAGN